MLERLRKGMAHVLASNEVLDAEELSELEERMHCPRIDEAADQSKVELVGRIKTTTYHPERPVRFEAELYDGHDSVTLTFLGRRRIPGVEPGRTMRVRGRVLGGNPRRIHNPWYELIAPEETH